MKQTTNGQRAAIYARVSSEQQADGGTIASQVAAVEERLQREGLSLDPEWRFLDDGYSGSTLVRPALERLRDAVASGAIDRLFVYSPDRLARQFACQANCCCRCKAWSPSTSGPRSWSEAGAANAMRPCAARSTC
jgi:predicted site-specific integrase-resolvase